jgi:4-methyl-5(b-hydroxyethyl)-thiazole monophosphate biosynthesis
LLLLSSGFEAYEASVFTDVLDWNMVEGDRSTKFVTCGIRKRLICTGHLTVIPELLTAEANVTEFDALAIPGGFESAVFYEDAYSEDFLSIIRKFDLAGKLLLQFALAPYHWEKRGFMRASRDNISSKQWLPPTAISCFWC